MVAVHFSIKQLSQDSLAARAASSLSDRSSMCLCYHPHSHSEAMVLFLLQFVTSINLSLLQPLAQWKWGIINIYSLIPNYQAESLSYGSLSPVGLTVVVVWHYCLVCCEELTGQLLLTCVPNFIRSFPYALLSLGGVYFSGSCCLQGTYTTLTPSQAPLFSVTWKLQRTPREERAGLPSPSSQRHALCKSQRLSFLQMKRLEMVTVKHGPHWYWEDVKQARL